jgi:phasin family protein
MYNASEQFAELNKSNVAQATKIAALALANAEKLFALNLNAVKSALAQGVEGASAAAGVKDVQQLLALPAKYAETNVQGALGYSRSLYEMASEAQAQYAALAEGHGRVGRPGEQVGPGRLGRRGQCVQVDVRGFDRRVRPVPEGDEAGREPGRRQRQRRRRQRVEGCRPEGAQGRVKSFASTHRSGRGSSRNLRRGSGGVPPGSLGGLQRELRSPL